MARNGFIKKYGKSDCIHVNIKDEDLVRLIFAYGEAKNLNATKVVEKCLSCNASMQTLVDGLEREKYELLDEDQKIDLILSLKKELSNNNGGTLC